MRNHSKKHLQTNIVICLMTFYCLFIMNCNAVFGFLVNYSPYGCNLCYPDSEANRKVWVLYPKDPKNYWSTLTISNFPVILYDHTSKDIMNMSDFEFQTEKDGNKFTFSLNEIDGIYMYGDAGSLLIDPQTPLEVKYEPMTLVNGEKIKIPDSYFEGKSFYTLYENTVSLGGKTKTEVKANKSGAIFAIASSKEKIEKMRKYVEDFFKTSERMIFIEDDNQQVVETNHGSYTVQIDLDYSSETIARGGRFSTGYVYRYREEWDYKIWFNDKLVRKNGAGNTNWGGGGVSIPVWFDPEIEGVTKVRVGETKQGVYIFYKPSADVYWKEGDKPIKFKF